MRHALDEPGIDGIFLEDRGIPDDEQLFAGSCESHVQFAVDGLSLFHTHVAEEVELYAVRHAAGVDDDIALAALIAFDGVDHDVVESLDA